MRYFKWVSGIVTRGDFGWSFQWGKPVSAVIAERLPVTLGISLLALIFSWLVAIPIGIYSATHQYSLVDYFATFIGFIGLATPGFLLAMILAWAANQFFGFSALGLYSTEFLDKPWSVAKALDMLQHLILPLIIIGMASAGSTIRVLRGNLLDELQKAVRHHRTGQGVTERQLLFKYPGAPGAQPHVQHDRLAAAGHLRRGAGSIVLSVPTIGPLLLKGSAGARHVPGRQHPADHQHADVIGTLLSDICWLGLTHAFAMAASANEHADFWRRRSRRQCTLDRRRGGPQHWVDHRTAPRRPTNVSITANPWKLIWWRFRRHRLALISLVLLVLLYLSAIFAEFVSPYTATSHAEGMQMMPPTKVHMIHDGQLQRPFIYALEKTLDQKIQPPAVSWGVLLKDAGPGGRSAAALAHDPRAFCDRHGAAL